MPMSEVFALCLLSGATLYHVPVSAVQAILAVERGPAVGAVCGNKDGSCDLGLGQINDGAWVPELARRFGISPAAVRDGLANDTCWNAQMTSWVLGQELEQAHGDLAKAIGNYHSRLPSEHWTYRTKAAAALEQLASNLAGIDRYRLPPSLNAASVVTAAPDLSDAPPSVTVPTTTAPLWDLANRLARDGAGTVRIGPIDAVLPSGVRSTRSAVSIIAGRPAERQEAGAGPKLVHITHPLPSRSGETGDVSPNLDRKH